MKKLLTFLCFCAIVAQFGYLLLKDHPHWPEVIWTPELWKPAEEPSPLPAPASVPAESTLPRADEASESAQAGVLPVDTDTSVKESDPLPGQAILAATVRVLAMDGQRGDRGNGCAVVIGLSDAGVDLLTADHVVEGASDIDVEFGFRLANGDTFDVVRAKSVEVLQSDASRDLAHLRVHVPTQSMSLRVLSLPESRVEQSWSDEPAAWMVDPSEWKSPQIIATEVVDRRRARRDDASPITGFLVLQNESRPGMSGGGLVNSQGQLIGIASGNSGGRTHCVDLTEIRQFLAGKSF